MKKHRMGQNVECKNIEWDKMSNGNKEEKEIFLVFCKLELCFSVGEKPM
jgi:hypothetical protein